jgi:hypothetical protein
LGLRLRELPRCNTLHREAEDAESAINYGTWGRTGRMSPWIREVEVKRTRVVDTRRPGSRVKAL